MEAMMEKRKDLNLARNEAQNREWDYDYSKVGLSKILENVQFKSLDLIL